MAARPREANSKGWLFAFYASGSVGGSDSSAIVPSELISVRLNPVQNLDEM